MIAFQVWSVVVTALALISTTYYAMQPFDEAYGEYYVES